MKIAYINPTTIMRRPIVELATILSKNNDITVFSPITLFNKKLNTHYSFSKKINISNYRTISLVKSMEWPIPISPLFLVKLNNLFRNNDVVHMWTYSYIVNFVALFFSKIYKTKLILTYDTVPGISISVGKFDFAYKIFYKLFSKFIFSNPYAVTVYGKSIKKISKKLTNREIKIIPTGTNIKLKSTKSVRKEFGIERKPLILFVGRISEIKGIDIFINVAKNKKFKDYIFLAVGSNLNKHIYNKYNKDLPKNVIFTGSRSDVYNFYSEANLFFLPSKGEGMPGVIMEAMKFGLPIVTSNVPGTKDLVKKDFAITNKNYSNSIHKILTNKKLFLKMSNAAKKESKKYSWDVLSKKYYELYSN